MSAVIVIGDEINNAGYRLAGADARAPGPAELADCFTAALASAQLVLLTRSAAAALAPAELQPALVRETPLVLVLPDIAVSQDHYSDTARRIRAVLGIES